MTPKTKLLIAGVVAVVLAIVGAMLPAKRWAVELSDQLHGAGMLGVLCFVGACAVGTLLFIPGFVFTAAAGLVWGFAGGTLIAFVSGVVGSALAFLVSRYLLRGEVEKIARRNEKFAALDHAVGRDGWKIVALLRLSPVLPYNIANYLYGVTAIRLTPYMLGSALGTFPGAVLWAYFGALGKATLSGQGNSGHAFIVVMAISAVATVIGALFVGRIAKRALRSASHD